MTKTAVLLFSFSFLIIFQLSSQNLLSNAGAEGGDPATVGWTSVAAGTSCYTGGNWRIAGGQNGFPSARSGSQIFFSGCGGAAGEIYQDVDVSANAATIDAGGADFTFTGYTQVYDQSPTDGARIIVEYLNAAKSTVLSSFDSGETNTIYAWQAITDTRTAPPGTRHVRVRMLSIAHNGDSVDGYFDDISISMSLLLPVELTNFRVQSTNNETAQISWATASEHNNDYFSIENSLDGETWISVGKVGGAGNSSETKSYSFLDEKPYEGISYYRLKQVDFDGQFSFSDVRSLKIGASNSIAVFPNPARGFITVDLNKQEPVFTEIINIMGQVVYANYSDFQTSFVIDLQNIGKGSYYLRVTSENQIMNERIVIE